MFVTFVNLRSVDLLNSRSTGHSGRTKVGSSLRTCGVGKPMCIVSSADSGILLSSYRCISSCKPTDTSILQYGIVSSVPTNFFLYMNGKSVLSQIIKNYVKKPLVIWAYRVVQTQKPKFSSCQEELRRLAGAPQSTRLIWRLHPAFPNRLLHI